MEFGRSMSWHKQSMPITWWMKCLRCPSLYVMTTASTHSALLALQSFLRWQDLIFCLFICRSQGSRWNAWRQPIMPWWALLLNLCYVVEFLKKSLWNYNIFHQLPWQAVHLSGTWRVQNWLQLQLSLIACC